MKYYFTEKGLVPITCTVEELFNSLCDNLCDNKYKHLMLRVLGIMINDDITVFKDSTTNEYALGDIITSHNRLILQASLDFNTYNHEEKKISSRIISRIDYQKGQVGYSANVYMISTAFLNTMVRRYYIDEMLETI